MNRDGIRTTPAVRLPATEHVPDYRYVDVDPPPRLDRIVWARSLTASPLDHGSPELALDVGLDRYLEHRAEVDRRAYERKLEQQRERKARRADADSRRAADLEADRRRAAARRQHARDMIPRLEQAQQRVAHARTWIDEQLEQLALNWRIVEMFQAGYRVRYIGARLGLDRVHVVNVLVEHGPRR